MSSKFMEIVKEVGEEMTRMGVQGQMEMASAIFNGNAFVPYGPGQRTTEAEKAIEPPESPSIESPEQSHGRSM